MRGGRGRFGSRGSLATRGRGGGRGGGLSSASFRGGRGGFSSRGGGRGFGGPRGGRGGAGHLPQHRRLDDAADSAAVAPRDDAEEVPAQGDEGPQTTLPVSRMVKTLINESGSEVPQRLNNKVFIDGLPFHHTAAPGKPSLEEELTQFIVDWKVGKVMRVLKKDGQGFGYVAFRSPNSVDVAVRVLNGRKFLGRPLRVEVPKPKELKALDEAANMRDLGKTSFDRQVLLSDLAKNSQPETLRDILKDVAPQLEKKVELIKMTANNRKAFVTLTSAEDVPAAVSFLNGFSMLGRRISAEQAAAPGTLPYSKGAKPVFSKLTDPSARKEELEEAGPSEDGDDADDEFIPLGYNTAVTSQKLPPPKKPDSASVAQRPVSMKGGSKEIYVGNLSDAVTASQLKAHFASCGSMAVCELLMHPSTHMPLGIGRIVFRQASQAAYAKANLHGSRLQGQTVRVDCGEEANLLREEQENARNAERDLARRELRKQRKATLPKALAPLADDEVLEDEDEPVDEEGFMRERYGVHNKKEFFKGTSMAEELEPDQKKHATEIRQNKERSQEVAKKNSAATAASSPKQPKRQREEAEEAAAEGAFCDAFAGSDADDEEDEHFFDVDDIPALPASSKKIKKLSEGAGQKRGKGTKSKKVRKQ